MPDSVRPHKRQPTRLPHPWDSPGKNTGVGCHFLLQCMTDGCLLLVSSDGGAQREPGTYWHRQMVNTKIRLIIFFAAKDGKALYSQQKQDQELTVAQIMRRAPAERLLWPGRASPSASQLLAFSPGQEQAAGVWETHDLSHSQLLVLFLLTV